MRGSRREQEGGGLVTRAMSVTLLGETEFWVGGIRDELVFLPSLFEP